MNLRKIEPDDFLSFQGEIEKSRNAVDRTLNLTWFYTQARFKISEKDFKSYHNVDGANDGGIDCFFQEGNTYYLIQSKYHERSQRESVSAITHELQKIEKTLVGKNTNKYAADFINSLRRVLNNPNTYLEIIWLTTNEVSENTRKDSQQFLSNILEKKNWKLNADINFIDRYALESVIYDIKHGYIPHTGKKTISFEPGECMIIDNVRNNIEAVVINAKAIEVLSWFENSREIEKYLQKNVRESIGEKNIINKKIKSSFADDPTLFWYKHNGIIIFADWLNVDEKAKKVTVRNPQIVNGAQTISQLYKAYDENRATNNPAKLLIRVYRLPYEDSETYRRSIEIISALNSQNSIKSSDLHSTDPRQVMLENRMDELEQRYRYFRKRSENSKSSKYNVKMTELAHCYYISAQKKPDEGIAGAIESYFEEDKRYSDAFPESQIKRPITNKPDHIIFKYIDSWRLYYFIDQTVYHEVSLKQRELWGYIYWYILVDCYNQLQDWKEKVFAGTWREWIAFISSNNFENGIIRYLKPRYRIYYEMLPKSDSDPRNFYKSTTGRNKFLKNSGDFMLFKAEINKVHQRFQRDNNY